MESDDSMSEFSEELYGLSEYAESIAPCRLPLVFVAACVTGLHCCWRLVRFVFPGSCVDVTVADGIWEGGKHGAG